MHLISQLFNNIPESELPARHSSEYVKFAQSEIFFHLAAVKHARIEELKKNFAHRGISKIFLSANLSGFDCTIPGIQVEVLEKNFFHESDPARRAFKQRQLAYSLVIVNNNDASAAEARAGYTWFYTECSSTIFITWDWDNHHWLDLSVFLASHSDIYAPAHHENLYLLSRYNWLTAGPMYCSSVQWSRKLLTENIEQILLINRSNAPLGMHIPYGQFSFRMQVISTLNQVYPSIGFSSRQFHDRTPEDKLQEWCAHKTHWISPVLNDVPIRLFDALITGGIPLVPDSMRLLPPIRTIPRDWIAFYSPADIVNPQTLVNHANQLFDRGGKDGIVARHRYALEHHHGNKTVLQMLECAREILAG